MTLKEIHDYVENHKEEIGNIKVSACRGNWFQISLIKPDNKHCSLSDIHFEIRKIKDDTYRLDIHFEENDTTRYKNNQELQELVNDNDFEWIRWWTSKKNNKNPDNKSLKCKEFTISTDKELEDFFEETKKIHKKFNDTLINILNEESTKKEEKKSMQVKNIILYGSPGVGKTHNTNKLIRLIEDGKGDREIFESIKKNEKSDSVDISDIKERVKFITFHQSFGYEDFIEGFRPNEEGKIELVDGVFKEICKNADKDRDNKYYLIIDEINRGNISKIFGELITLIEEDKRDTLEVTLPYSKQPFKIPSNLYIIGTMNSTDKSIALIDIALRRRFTFLKMKPNDVLITFPKAKDIFIALNNQITQDLGEDYQIGHSYFMKIADNSDLDFVLEYKIIPLLEEYYYGDDRLEESVKLCKLNKSEN